MGLPLSGQISMNDIRVELGVPSQSPFGLDEARSGTYVALNPYSPTSPPSTGEVSLASWYGYCQNCYTHSFSYNSLLANKCVNNDPITIISNTNPIVVGSLLFLDDYSQAFYPYYYTDGTDYYYADTNESEQTEVMSLGSCSGPSYELYTADRYECIDNVCEFVETIQIGNPTVLVEGKFYLDLINFYIFNIVGAPGAGPYLITSMSGLGTNNCNSLCSV